MSPKLAALLRQDFSKFLWKAFLTVSPGDEYLPNWHIDAIAHQLNAVTAGKVEAADPQSAAAFVEVDRHLRCLRRLAARA